MLSKICHIAQICVDIIISFSGCWHQLILEDTAEKGGQNKLTLNVVTIEQNLQVVVKIMYIIIL